eukprot:EG_transcript_10165
MFSQHHFFLNYPLPPLVCSGAGGGIIPAGKRVASRTVEWTGTAYNRRQGVTGDVVVVVDRSPSLEPAWEAVLAYLRRRVLGTDLAGGSRMGLVAFDGAAAVVTDLTADRQALMAGVNALAVGDGGPTHLAAALDAGVAAFGDSEPRRARFLEVLTDRLGDDGRWALERAAAHKAAGVVVLVVGVGPAPEAGPLQVLASDPAEEHWMRLGALPAVPAVADILTHRVCFGPTAWTDEDGQPTVEVELDLAQAVAFQSPPKPAA